MKYLFCSLVLNFALIRTPEQIGAQKVSLPYWKEVLNPVYNFVVTYDLFCIVLVIIFYSKIKSINGAKVFWNTLFRITTEHNWQELTYTFADAFEFWVCVHTQNGVNLSNELKFLLQNISMEFSLIRIHLILPKVFRRSLATDGAQNQVLRWQPC